MVSLFCSAVRCWMEAVIVDIIVFLLILKEEFQIFNCWEWCLLYSLVDTLYQINKIPYYSSLLRFKNFEYILNFIKKFVPVEIVIYICSVKSWIAFLGLIMLKQPYFPEINLTLIMYYDFYAPLVSVCFGFFWYLHL